MDPLGATKNIINHQPTASHLTSHQNTTQKDKPAAAEATHNHHDKSVAFELHVQKQCEAQRKRSKLVSSFANPFVTTTIL